MTTPRQQLSDNVIKAQKFSLDSHEKELELVVTAKLLSTCVSKGIIRRADKDMITGTKAEKVAIFKQLMVNNPLRYGQILNIVKENKNTKYVANIIQKTKVAHEKFISDYENKVSVVKELEKCLGKETDLTFEEQGTDLTLVIKGLIESVQTAHPECQELQNKSMAELQDDIIKMTKELKDTRQALKKSDEGLHEECKKSEEKDRELENLRNELSNRKLWITCCEKEIENLKTEVENLKMEVEKLTHQVMVHKETSTADRELETTPKISRQSSETTPKISRQSSETTPKIDEENETINPPTVNSPPQGNTEYQAPYKHDPTPKNHKNQVTMSVGDRPSPLEKIASDGKGQTSEDDKFQELTPNTRCPNPDDLRINSATTATEGTQEDEDQTQPKHQNPEFGNDYPYQTDSQSQPIIINHLRYDTRFFNEETLSETVSETLSRTHSPASRKSSISLVSENMYQATVNHIQKGNNNKMFVGDCTLYVKYLHIHNHGKQETETDQ